MSIHEGFSPDDTLHAKLKAAVEGLPAIPPWHDAWAKLTLTSTEEERLEVYQLIRKAGTIPEEATFFLVSSMIDEIASRDVGDVLRGYEDRLKEIEKKFGFCDGGIWPTGTAPAGYEDLRQQYYRAWDDLFQKKLEDLGEPEMARLFQTDPNRFDQLTDAGREYFFGPENDVKNAPVIWVHRLVEAVSTCMMADSPMGPLGCHFLNEDETWLIDVYPAMVEVVGGKLDGELLTLGFSLDLEQLRKLFERVDAMHWQSLGLSDAEGPMVAIEGIYEGHDVYLQVLTYAPEDEEPGMKLNTL